MIDDRVSGSRDGDWRSRSSRFPGRWSVILDLNDSRPMGTGCDVFDGAGDLHRKTHKGP